MSQYKSLSADSELQDAYVLFYSGEYKQSLHIIKKKLPKLKSSIDIAYFNILKIRLLEKLHKPKEQKILFENLKEDFLKKDELLTDDFLLKKFLNILRNNNDYKTANEIFKKKLEKKNLNDLKSKEQHEILKELTINGEFKEIIKMINIFIKNNTNFLNNNNNEFVDENEKKTLIKETNNLELLKYEINLFLFNNKLFSEKMLSFIYKDLIKKFDKLRSIVGYYDILAQYLILFKDYEKFFEFFEKKKNEELTHAPFDEIKMDILLNNNKLNETIQFLVKNIFNNKDKCVFVNYERLINLVFDFFNKNNIKIDENKIVNNNENNFNIENIPLIENNIDLVNFIINLFDYIKNISDKNLNMFKSGILGKLMIFHNIISLNNNYNENIKNFLIDNILLLLQKAEKKHSILFELNKYFIYLNENERKKLFDNFNNKITVFDIKENNNLETFIFIQKLKKILFNLQNNNYNVYYNEILYLTKSYLIINQTIYNNNLKLEKGERNPADDLIILANEYFYEFLYYNNNNLNTSLSNLMLLINIHSHKNSPYNYDISYYLCLIFSYLNLNKDSLDILKYMNLKGPQYETVSYFIFNKWEKSYFKEGINYIINQNSFWQNDVNTNNKKILYKMFKNGNFWNSEELLKFYENNNNSYYNFLLNYFELLFSLNDNLYNKDGIDDNEIKDIIIIIEEKFKNFENNLKEENCKIINNQDMFITMHKYNYINYFNNNFDMLKINNNFCESNYNFNIDKLNKEKNILYKYYPSFKNNFIKNCKEKTFKEFLGKFDDFEYLYLKYISIIIIITKLYYINNEKDFKLISEEIKIINEKYKNYSNKFNNIFDLDVSNLISIYIECENNIEYLNENLDKILNNYKNILEKLKYLNQFKNELKYNDINNLNIFYNEIFEIKNNYLIFYTIITSKFIDLINDKKKELKNYLELKSKFNENFKSPIINILKEYEKKMDDLINNENVSININFNVGDLFDDKQIVINDEIKNNLNDLEKKIENKIKEKNKEMFKEIKECSKRMIDFIKSFI